MSTYKFCPPLLISLLTLSLSLANAASLPITAPPAELNAELNLDAFYAKYLDCGGISVIGSRGIADDKGRPINTRDQLQNYDPQLAALIGDIFKHPERHDWRHVPHSRLASP